MRLRWWWEDADTADRMGLAYLVVCALILLAVLAIDDAGASKPAPKPVSTVVAAPPSPLTPRETPRATRSKPRTPSATPKPPQRVQVSHRGTQGLSGVRRYARGFVSPAQWACLDRLWQKESGWDATQVGPLNPDGRYPVGIPQLKGLKTTDTPRYQVQRGLTYIKHRYSTPCAAWAHSQAKGWY